MLFLREKLTNNNSGLTWENEAANASFSFYNSFLKKTGLILLHITCKLLLEKVLIGEIHLDDIAETNDFSVISVSAIAIVTVT